MAVVRTLDRVRDGLEAVFEQRSAPDDLIEFDASIEMLRIHSEEDDTCTAQTVINIWVALMCPEMDAKSTCQVIVPLYLLEDEDEVTTVGNQLWDSIQANRALAGLELDGQDHPDGG